MKDRLSAIFFAHLAASYGIMLGLFVVSGGLPDFRFAWVLFAPVVILVELIAFPIWAAINSPLNRADLPAFAVYWGVYLVIFAGSYLLIAMRRKKRRRIPGTCPHCGYDLRASPQRCPECGHWPRRGPTIDQVVENLRRMEK